MVLPAVIIGVIAVACVGAAVAGAVSITATAVGIHIAKRRRSRKYQLKRHLATDSTEFEIHSPCRSLTFSCTREHEEHEWKQPLVTSNSPIIKRSHSSTNRPKCARASHRSRYQVVSDQETGQKLHCMIFASYGDKPPRGAVAKLKLPFTKRKFLPGVKKDVENIQEMIKRDKQKPLIDVTQVLYLEERTSDSCKEHIKKQMQDIKVENQDTSNGLLIWYTGHGNGKTGNWPMKNRTELKFADVYALYEKYFRGRPLYIVCDCCYSGAWVEECARLLDKDGIHCGHEAERDGMCIKVFAACLPHEKAYDNFYVKMNGARLHKCDKTVCFAKHQRIGKSERHCQCTLGVDFTDTKNADVCIDIGSGKCRQLSTWTKYVRDLIQQEPSTCYLV